MLWVDRQVEYHSDSQRYPKKETRDLPNQHWQGAIPCCSPARQLVRPQSLCCCSRCCCKRTARRLHPTAASMHLRNVIVQHHTSKCQHSPTALAKTGERVMPCTFVSCVSADNAAHQKHAQTSGRVVCLFATNACAPTKRLTRHAKPQQRMPMQHNCTQKAQHMSPT
jgi:hypothetical protein